MPLFFKWRYKKNIIFFTTCPELYPSVSLVHFPTYRAKFFVFVFGMYNLKTLSRSHVQHNQSDGDSFICNLITQSWCFTTFLQILKLLTLPYLLIFNELFMPLNDRSIYKQLVVLAEIVKVDVFKNFSMKITFCINVKAYITNRCTLWIISGKWYLAIFSKLSPPNL